MVARQSRQSDEGETAASGPDSEAHGHESAQQLSAADVASTSPSEHDGAQPPTASPASAKQERQGAAASVAAASVAAETAEVVAQPMDEHAVATRPDQQPIASTTASLHINQPAVSQSDVPGIVPMLLSCHPTVSVSDWCCQSAYIKSESVFAENCACNVLQLFKLLLTETLCKQG